MRGLNPLTSKILKSPATNAGDAIGVLLGQRSKGHRETEVTIRAQIAAVNGDEEESAMSEASSAG